MVTVSFKRKHNLANARKNRATMARVEKNNSSEPSRASRGIANYFPERPSAEDDASISSHIEMMKKMGRKGGMKKMMRSMGGLGGGGMPPGGMEG